MGLATGTGCCPSTHCDNSNGSQPTESRTFKRTRGRRACCAQATLPRCVVIMDLLGPSTRTAHKPANREEKPGADCYDLRREALKHEPDSTDVRRSTYGRDLSNYTRPTQRVGLVSAE